VDTLHHEYSARSELESLPRAFSRAGLEIEGRALDLLAAEEGDELLVEELDVQCLEALEVIFAVLVAGGALALDEVIVQGEGGRLESDDLELDGQLLGRSRLARARGPAMRTTFTAPALDAISSAMAAIFLFCRASATWM